MDGARQSNPEDPTSENPKAAHADAKGAEEDLPQRQKSSGPKEVPLNSTEASAPRAETVLQEQFIAIDVECVATGISHRERALGSVAAVDENEQTIFFEYVKPDVPVRSCLTQLTGIQPVHLTTARSAPEVVADLKRMMHPLITVIVGQSVQSDIDWLGLKEGVDFKRIEDTAQIFRCPRPSDPRKYQYFSLRHIVRNLLGEDPQPGTHSPIEDARYAMRLVNRYGRGRCAEAKMNQIREALTKAPHTPSFASQVPFIDGCEVSKASTRYYTQPPTYTAPMAQSFPAFNPAAFGGPAYGVPAYGSESLRGPPQMKTRSPMPGQAIAPR